MLLVNQDHLGISQHPISGSLGDQRLASIAYHNHDDEKDDDGALVVQTVAVQFLIIKSEFCAEANYATATATCSKRNDAHEQDHDDGDGGD